jgi:hypothetical protein
VEAVKKNQIGVAPQESAFLVSTAPGTIPTHVRPPRIPELSGSPLVADAAPPPTMAIADTSATQPAAKSDSGSLFGSLFASKPEPKAAEKSEGTIDRMARLIGLGNDSKSDEAKAKPKQVAKQVAKPVAKPTRVASHGAIPPKQADTAAPAKQAEAAPVRTTEAQAPAAPAAAAPPRPASTALNGAAPVVPTGNFDNRWSGFR